MSRFENFDLLRVIASKFNMKGLVNGPNEMDTSSAKWVVDMMGGGFIGREAESGGNWSPGIDIAGINSLVIPLIHKDATSVNGPFIRNNDRKDRRVLAAEVNIIFAAAPAVETTGIEVGYYLKPDPDSSVEIGVAWARHICPDGVGTQFRFPLTGWCYPMGHVFGSDPPYIDTMGVAGVASTWDKLVPAGWGFYAYIAYWGGAGLVNFPAATKAFVSVGALAAAQGLQVPW